jgi:hypothetical protein
MTMTAAEIRSLHDDPTSLLSWPEGRKKCGSGRHRRGLRVTGRARENRFAKVLESLKALPAAQAKRLTACARKCPAAEEVLTGSPRPHQDARRPLCANWNRHGCPRSCAA